MSDWIDTAELVGFAAIVASPVFVGIAVDADANQPIVKLVAKPSMMDGNQPPSKD